MVSTLTKATRLNRRRFLAIASGLLVPAWAANAGPAFFLLNHRSVSTTDSPSNYANLKLWLKADSLGLSDNTQVSSWLDQSGNSNDASQGTSGNQPIFKTNIFGTLPSVRFDNSNDYMSLVSAVSSTSFSAPWTIIFVAKFNSGGGSRLLYGSGTGDAVARTSTGETIIIQELGSGARGTTSFANAITVATMGVIRKANGSATVEFFEGKTARGSAGTYNDHAVLNKIG